MLFQNISTLTIGDGLASQVPSLLMSIAAGVFMTRSSAANSLGTDVTGQIVSKPNALFLASGFLWFLAVTGPTFTGLPFWPFFLFGLGLAIAGFSTLINADVQSQLGQLENVRQNMQDLVNPNRMYERLGVDVLSLQVGSNLLVIADPDQEGQLLAKIAALRQRVTDELGYILPNIRIMDSSALDANEYLIAIRGNTVATGYVYPGRLMVIADQWVLLSVKFRRMRLLVLILLTRLRHTGLLQTMPKRHVLLLQLILLMLSLHTFRNA